MLIEINVGDDAELNKYFSEVDEPARPYVARQLIKLGIKSGMTPFAQINYHSPVPVNTPSGIEPDFNTDYSDNAPPIESHQPPAKKIAKRAKISSEKKTTVVKELTVEERKQKLSGKLGNF